MSLVMSHLGVTGQSAKAKVVAKVIGSGQANGIAKAVSGKTGEGDSEADVSTASRFSEAHWRICLSR